LAYLEHFAVDSVNLLPLMWPWTRLSAS